MPGAVAEKEKQKTRNGLEETGRKMPIMTYHDLIVETPFW